MSTSLDCTSCGAPIEITNRFSKVVCCDYCGTHLKMQDDGFEASGKYAKLAEFPSIFELGSRGTILGKPFSALGRIRYNCDGSHYDEWFLDYEGEQAWFCEDEGTYTLYTESFEIADMPDIESVRAGQNITVGGKKVMVKEVGESTVDGGEGELSYYVEPGTEVIYIDGVAEGKKVSIEYSEGEVELFMGRPLLKRDIVVGG
ncbi:MAG: DUF4178 domain-containing protein [bacterium]|nr:DUF4178 domain-containing protein [bacterium]